MAAQNAKELQELQSRLTDANTVVEKHNQGIVQTSYFIVSLYTTT